MLKTDIYSELENFNKKKQEIIYGEKIKEKNLLLKEKVGRISDIILKYQVQKKKLTRELLIKEFENPQVLLDFYIFMENEIRSRDIGYNTKRCHLSVVHNLKKFKNSLLMTELDENFIIKYVANLKKLNRKTNTIHKDLKILKTYVNIARKKELLTINPFVFYKLKTEKTYPEYLSEDERNKLLELHDADKLTEKERTILRIFLFQCFTGLRISDIKNIEWENINKNNILIYKPIKTNETTGEVINLPLSKTAIKLLKIQKQYSWNGKIFNKYCNQEINKQLKLFADICKIKKSISTHTGRHTFATIFLKKAEKASGILILQKLLGHSSIKSTMIYTHVLNDDVIQAIKMFD